MKSTFLECPTVDLKGHFRLWSVHAKFIRETGRAASVGSWLPSYHSQVVLVNEKVKSGGLWHSLVSDLHFGERIQCLNLAIANGQKENWFDQNLHQVFVVVQLLSHIQLFATPGTAALQSSLPFTTSGSLLKFMFIESVMPSNHVILYCPLHLLPLISVFSIESALHIRWPKYWSFSISPSNEYSGLISFRNDWFDLLAIQGTLKSLLQHHNLKAPVLWCSAFFMVQLSHPYMNTRKTIALTVFDLE